MARFVLSNTLILALTTKGKQREREIILFNWSKFYKDKKENYLLIKVVTKKLEVLDYKHGTLGNKETRKTPFVTF